MYSAKTGARLVAGTVILSRDRNKVLLISSEARPDCWIVPKGGVEKDEPDPEASAIRETWEEAGVTGKIVRSLGIVEDKRPPKTWPSDTTQGALSTWPPRSEFHFYELEFEAMDDVFPECHKRKRYWATYSEAKDKLMWDNRAELVEALERSSINKQL